MNLENETDWPERWERGARTFYVAELVRQSAYALLALNRAVEMAEAGLEPEPWPQVQAFLGAAANVSKILWPVRVNDTNLRSRWRKFRGEKLRSELEIADSSALRDRTIRNVVEHYDERLDEVVRDVPLNYRDERRREPSLQAPFRVLDLEARVIVAGNNAMALGPIVSELFRLRESCASLEPRAIGRHDVVAMLASLRWPPLPSLFDPGDPSIPITAGADIDQTGPQTLEDVVAILFEKLASEEGDSK